MSDRSDALTDPLTDPLAALLALMARLRDPERGCPWDLQQSFATIAPFTIEEAYEVADAIARGEPVALRDELGDLLFQVVFHARMAEERGWFGFADVARAIHDKLVRRHPHVFAPDAGGREVPLEELSRTWEEQKARERAARASEAEPAGVLDDVPQGLPALARAAKLGRRAARVGFDWSQPGEVRTKVLEEIGELTAACEAGDPAAVAEEAGDLLFAMASWARHLGLDPEETLRAANRKFEGRFRQMEALARSRGVDLSTLSAVEWDTLWNDVKKPGAHVTERR